MKCTLCQWEYCLNSTTNTYINTSGESGLVYKAYLNTTNGKELVAVKTVKGNMNVFL